MAKQIQAYGQMGGKPHERRHFDQVRRQRRGRGAWYARRHFPARPKAHRAEGWVKFQMPLKRQHGAARKNAGL